MRPSIPPGFTALIDEYGMLPAGETVLCAVSGGADSMCLLHLLSRREGILLHAAHFDHRLRGEESDADAAFVQDWCTAHSIPFHLGSADVAAQARASGQGIEETARELRYAFLQHTAQKIGADVIATAHNADDNAETLLLHLIRGTGLQGLTGIPPRRNNVVRPLLTTSRAEILAYLEEFQIPHREDSSNSDESYARNKLRAQVMPVLRELNPRFVHSAAAAIQSLRTDHSYLSELAAEACQNARWEGNELVIDSRRIAALPPALAPRGARLLIELAAGGFTDCTAAHLSGLVELCRSANPSASLSLPYGLTARRVYEELHLAPNRGSPPTLEPTPLRFRGVTTPPNSLFSCLCRKSVCPPAPEPGVWYFSQDALGPDALLRPRQRGDALSIPHRGGSKTVKRWLIDAKIPRWEREQIPVLADSQGTAALAGFGPEQSRLAAPGEPAWAVSFQRVEKEREKDDAI